MSPAPPIDLVNGDHGGGSASDSSALAGAPILTMPMELFQGLPVAVSLWGRRGSDATLLQLGRALEQRRDASAGPLPEPTFVEML
jgi:amidase